MTLPSHIGRYVVQDLLGEGAMGRVYKGYDPNLERPVAIKTLRLDQNRKPEDLQEIKDRFLLEARVNGRLSHPNIVNVYDSGLFDGEPFLVMEQISGQTLDLYVREQLNREPVLYFALLEQIGMALDYAHEEGVVHRDVKPGNVLVAKTRSGSVRIKVVDFGLARLKDSKMTQTGFFMGTPSYASPEQITSGKVDFRSDLYSLGTLAYEMLTGSLPFEAESLHAILYRIANEPPDIDLSPYEQLCDTLSIKAVFEKAFAKDPDVRYQSAHDLVRALQQSLGDEEGIRRVFEQKAALKATPPPVADSKPPETVELSENRSVHQARAQFLQALKTGNVSSIRYCLEELKALNADVADEERMLRQLEAEQKLIEQEERVEKARSAFAMALRSRNLQSSRYCLGELEHLGCDCATEKKQLERLAIELKEEQKRQQLESQRIRQVKALRLKFNQGVEARKPEQCASVIVELESIGASFDEEKLKLDELILDIRKRDSQRKSWIQRVRESFEQAYLDRDVERCQKLLVELENLLKVDVSREREALQELIKQKEQEAMRQLDAHIEEATRTEFRNALERMDLESCRTAFATLKEKNANTTEEKKAMAQLMRRLEQQKADKLRSDLIMHTREKFDAALEAQKVENARYYYKELEQLTDDLSSEKSKLEAIERGINDRVQLLLRENALKRLREELAEAESGREVARARTILAEMRDQGIDGSEAASVQVRIDRLAPPDSMDHQIEQLRFEFNRALKIKDVAACQAFLKELQELGVTTAHEVKTLNDLVTQLDQLSVDGALDEENCRLEFIRAFKSGNEKACLHYLEMLRSIGADTDSEQEALEILSSRKG